MAIARVSAQEGSGTTMVVSTNPTTGYLLIFLKSDVNVAAPSYNTGTAVITTPSLITSRDPGAVGVSIYRSTVTTGGTLTINWGDGGDPGGGLVQLSGVDTTNPIRVSAVSASEGAADSTPNASSYSPTAGDFCLAIYGDETGSSSVTARGTGYTRILYTSGHLHAIVENTSVAGGAETVEFNSSVPAGANAWAVATVAFKPAAAGGGTVGRLAQGGLVRGGTIIGGRLVGPRAQARGVLRMDPPPGWGRTRSGLIVRRAA